MTEVRTDTMKPNATPPNGEAVTVIGNTLETPPEKPARRRRRKTVTEPKAKPTPTPEQFEMIGRLTYEAHVAGTALSEHIDMMRATVEAYDAVFGEG